MNQHPKTLELDASVLEEIDAHAAETYPRECCGILLGRRQADVWRAERAFRATNLAGASIRDRYEMDPHDRLKAEHWARENACEIVGFYHSHPDHDVYFSPTDLQNSEEYLMGEPWLEPTYAYLVVSIKEGKPAGRGAFRVIEGRSESIALQGGTAEA